MQSIASRWRSQSAPALPAVLARTWLGTSGLPLRRYRTHQAAKRQRRKNRSCCNLHVLVLGSGSCSLKSSRSPSLRSRVADCHASFYVFECGGNTTDFRCRLSFSTYSGVSSYRSMQLRWHKKKYPAPALDYVVARVHFGYLAQQSHPCCVPWADSPCIYGTF